MNRNTFKKLTSKDKSKINNRYLMKYNEFKLLSNEELKKLTETKMSSTDRFALQIAIESKMKETILKNKEADDSE